MTTKNLISRLFFYLTTLVSINLQSSESQEPEELKTTLIKVIANQDAFPYQARKAAFDTLRTLCIKTEPHHISYCEHEEISIIQEVPSHIYEQIIKSMPICCVDTFVYHFEKKAYLMIQRTAPPAKGLWWIPGGRVLKGESFYESAIRKVKVESGLDICPIAKLSTYSTYFPESAWACHTDTKNTIILALCNDECVSSTEHHDAFKWVPIDEAPDDPYMQGVYGEAKAKLIELGFIYTVPIEESGICKEDCASFLSRSE